MLYALLCFVFQTILSFNQPFIVSHSRRTLLKTKSFFSVFHIFFFVVKYNKITQGLISQGQCARDINLFTTDGQPATLFSQISAGQPLIILAGSTS
jgi:hypothetical protein